MIYIHVIDISRKRIIDEAEPCDDRTTSDFGQYDGGAHKRC
jgi:hypothetical protein